LAAVVIQLTKKRHYFGANFFLKILLDEIFDLYTTYITLVMFLVIFSQKLQLQKQEILKKEKERHTTCQRTQRVKRILTMHSGSAG